MLVAASQARTLSPFQRNSTNKQGKKCLRAALWQGAKIAQAQDTGRRTRTFVKKPPGKRQGYDIEQNKKNMRAIEGRKTVLQLLKNLLS